MSELIKVGERAKKAWYGLSSLTSGSKDKGLRNISEALIKFQDKILKANEKDVEAALQKGIKGSLIDRLTLNSKRIQDMADGVLEIAALKDPVGEITSMWMRPNGLQIGKQRVPLGIIGIIYEARPNVTVDAAALCLKASNAVILRGGSEAINSNKAIVSIIKDALALAGYPENSIQLIEDTTRETVVEMMKLNKYIDVLIPRGGAALIETVVNNSTIPVIETGVGNCHIYVDNESDFDMAEKIIINAKTSRPGVCNAAETMLVHQNIYKTFLPKALGKLSELGVSIRGCERTCEVFKSAAVATEEDWKTEYLDFILAVKVVDSIEDAISHINTYGTCHSECIVTTNYQNSRKFLKEINAAAVYVNASTRFTDGSEFGFGAELGISTGKLHARGPMGLNELTIEKYIIYGEGQVR